MPQILSTLHTTGPRSRSVTVLHPWLFINTTRNNLLCSDFRQTALSDVSDLLLCDAHPFIYISRLCLSQLFFDRSPAPLSSFRGGRRHRNSHQCSAACQEAAESVLLQAGDRCHDSFSSMTDAWMLIPAGYWWLMELLVWRVWRASEARWTRR